MSAGKAIYSLLSGSTVLADIVGTEIYPDVAPSSATYPHVIFSTIDDVPHKAMGSALDFLESDVQIDAYVDDTQVQPLQTLLSTLSDVLHDYSGSTSGLDVDTIQLENTQPGLFENIGSGDAAHYVRRGIQDYVVWYRST